MANKHYHALLNNEISLSSFVTLSLPKGKTEDDGDISNEISLLFFVTLSEPKGKTKNDG